jgi:hypothetical protein
MKKSLPLLLIGAVFIAGCAGERQADKNGVQPIIVQKANPEGLDFLADIPSLKDVSLNMSEEQLLDILHRQKLDYTREIIAGQTTYWVKPKVHVIVIFGFRQGRCSGIQRMPD